MCMLIHHPASARPFTRAEIEDFNRRNPHGFGIIWRAPSGVVRSRRGHLDVGEQWRFYQGLRAAGVREMALHWRFATAGARTEANCHPFPVPGTTILMMHNGARIGPSTADESDSAVFAREVLAPALAGRPHLLCDAGWVRQLGRQIGGGNRLILWDTEDPDPVIVGEKLGVRHKGRWYSNEYAWSAPKPKPTVRRATSRRNWEQDLAWYWNVRDAVRR